MGKATKEKKSKNISSGAQHATLQKYFSHPSLVIFKFLQPHP
jgi:hypothetical protein